MVTAQSPARLSPLGKLHVDAGAIMTEVAGWHIADSYGDVEEEIKTVTESVGVCDISGRSAVRVKSYHLEDVFGDRAPVIGSILRRDDAVIARLTGEELLAIGPRMARRAQEIELEREDRHPERREQNDMAPFPPRRIPYGSSSGRL